MAIEGGATRFNRALVMERLEDDQDLFVMLAEMFINDAGKYADSLRAAVGDLPKLEREAHTVKGVMATFADEAGAALALSVERAAREGKAEAAVGNVEPLCQMMAELVEILKAEI